LARKRGGDGDAVAVDSRVRVYPGTNQEARGVVVEDFGDSAGHAVEVGGNLIAEAARRWAVRLDNGSLVFVDNEHIAPE
jgi:hypothetical protein